jgi:hypothetical protein
MRCARRPAALAAALEASADSRAARCWAVPKRTLTVATSRRRTSVMQV